MESLILEIKAAEGGDDAKLLVKTQENIYKKYCIRGAFEFNVLKDLSGYVTARVSGKGSKRAFKDEGGGHRWQRVSPTERKGRVHTSTITVAVLPDDMAKKDFGHIRHSDVVESVARGKGPGGQHKNKKDTAVQLKHVPTGIIVRSDKERSQHANRETAWKVLRKRIANLESNLHREAIDADRKGQMGSGMRGDKRRTYRERDDQVVDHITGKKATLARIMRGDVHLLLAD